MRHSIQILLYCLIVTTPLLGQSSELEKQLYGLPDLIFKPITTPEGYEAAYELQIRQPIDHEAPEKGHFYQRAYLTHRSFDAPVVLATEGYIRPSNRMYELTDYLEANQVDVEHRYFGTSVPDSLDYRYLNLKQVAGDLHRLRALLGEVYKQPWVSTGISKGGQTTIFYRYFYPNDVAASVPYVAPLNLELTDDRIYDFLDTVGTEACRTDILELQIRMLEERGEVLPRLRWYAKGAGLTFEYLKLEKAFEYAVLEYPFSFWQLGNDCRDIPGDEVRLDSLLTHFLEVVPLSFYADVSMAAYGSHYWQAGDEMGYYGYQTEPFKDLLQEIEEPEPSAVFMPGKTTPGFQPGFLRDVFEWTQRSADQMIYIYGAMDTWTATGVPPSDDVEALWFIMPGKDHGNARIRNLPEEQRELLLRTLKGWIHQKVNR